jgi:putative two-component system response regulator
MSVDRQTILVVDDVPQNIDVLAGILSNRYRVKAAPDGARALAIARSSPAPDLILLDIMMPGMDGFAVCTALKADLRTQRIPVIFITAMSEVEDEARGFALGAVDYITKPVSQAIVEARVKTHLALYQQERELERKVRERTTELLETRLSIIRCLGRAAEYKDDQTGKHVIRMSHYSRLLGRAAGLTEADADLLMNAAPMHDIGKIGIPDQILKKAGTLDAEEWSVMQQHVNFGVEILADQASSLLTLAREIAASHHEKWDGSGYPAGLKGEAIPLAGRIVAIADVYDALTSPRPYKEAWPVDEVVAHMVAGSGQHFDPALIELFVPLVPAFEEIRLRYQDTADT